MSGAVGYHSGLSAEAIVEGRYAAAGFRRSAHRWRGRTGEIDLIMTSDETTVFVEVKQSRSHEQAAHAVGCRQQARILSVAQEYLATCPDGLESDCRFDVALVNGGGEVAVLENAFGQF